ncbi:MAG TPA: DUF4129 domain-containing protein, partial [Thermoanaerobaculia bacterium]
TSRVAWWRRLVTVGREIELFYDRRILGFDSGDQVQLTEAFRETFSDAARSMKFWKGATTGSLPGGAKIVIVLFALAVLGLVAARGISRRPGIPAATRAYLALRRLLARRIGSIGPGVAPAEVARLFEAASPASAADARAVVEAYCESAFGGRSTEPATARELRERLRRLRKIA